MHGGDRRPPISGGTSREGALVLTGVPETALLTLYDRALEARRADARLRDPRAIELVERIDYPFAERFGPGGSSQWAPLRAVCVDRVVRRFALAHPGGMVVALGEGLETQFWRVDDGRVQWLTVDVPEMVAVRSELLGDEPRRRAIACDAFDERWMDEVDRSRGVLLTAQGLLPYCERDRVHRLIAAIAERFGGGAFVFDVMPRWLSERSTDGFATAGGYRPPPWPWGFDDSELRALRALHPRIAGLRRLRIPRGHGLIYGFALPLTAVLPRARDRAAAVLRMTFI
jgi:O-methyltransferase involved in polyketide biosynthesis